MQRNSAQLVEEVDRKINQGITEGYIKNEHEGRKAYYPYCMLIKYGGHLPDDTPLIWPPTTEKKCSGGGGNDTEDGEWICSKGDVGEENGDSEEEKEDDGDGSEGYAAWSGDDDGVDDGDGDSDGDGDGGGGGSE